MILDYETIINKIIDSSGLSRADIENKIQIKVAELQDLISKEGAAHMVSNELGIKLFDNTNRTVKIEKIQTGMNSVNLVGKVIKINETKTFNKNNRSGRIGSLTLGDETGIMRLVVWDEKLIDLIKEISEGDILKIANGYVKQNNNFKELHLGSKSQLLINPENESISEVKISIIPTIKRKKINALQENDFVEVIGTIVQVFEPKYYNACPVCNKKVMPQGDSFTCQEHNVVPAKQTPIMNIFFDDGTGNIRGILFRDQAVKLMAGKTNTEEIKKENLGKQIIAKGRVTKNEMFDRIEFAINSFEDLQPEKLIEEIQSA